MCPWPEACLPLARFSGKWALLLYVNVSHESQSEKGFSLPEVIVSVGMAAFVLAATLAAVLPAVHHLAPDPTTTALRQLVDREMHVAGDLLKYSGSSLVPATIATSVPIPNASPIPVTLQLQITNLGIWQVQNATVGQAIAVTISAHDASGKHAAQAQMNVSTRAPQPGMTIAPAALVPAPTGAP